MPKSDGPTSWSAEVNGYSEARCIGPDSPLISGTTGRLLKGVISQTLKRYGEDLLKRGLKRDHSVDELGSLVDSSFEGLSYWTDKKDQFNHLFVGNFEHPDDSNFGRYDSVLQFEIVRGDRFTSINILALQIVPKEGYKSGLVIRRDVGVCLTHFPNFPEATVSGFLLNKGHYEFDPSAERMKISAADFDSLLRELQATRQQLLTSTPKLAYLAEGKIPVYIVTQPEDPVISPRGYGRRGR